MLEFNRPKCNFCVLVLSVSAIFLFLSALFTSATAEENESSRGDIDSATLEQLNEISNELSGLLADLGVEPARVLIAAVEIAIDQHDLEVGNFSAFRAEMWCVDEAICREVFASDLSLIYHNIEGEQISAPVARASAPSLPLCICSGTRLVWGYPSITDCARQEPHPCTGS